MTDVIRNGQNNANQQTTRFATGQNSNQQTPRLSAEQCSSGVQQTSVASTTTQSSNRWCQTFASPVAEFNAILKRGALCHQLQRGSGNVSSFLPNLTQRSRTRQSSASGQHQQSAHTPEHRKSNSVFTQEVVLLPDPSSKSVVKGKKRQNLLKIVTLLTYSTLTEVGVTRMF